MRIQLSLLFAAIIFVFPRVSAATVSMTSSEPGEYKLSVQIDETSYSMQTQKVNGTDFVLLQMNEGIDRQNPGMPDIPKLHRWLAVDPAKNYTLTYEVSDPVTYTNILLYPVQPDTREGQAAAPFTMSSKAYQSISWYGSETVTLAEKAMLGATTILPVAISPFRYNAAARTLRLYRKIDITIRAIGTSTQDSYLPKHISNLTSFQKEQLRLLTLNSHQVLANLPKDAAAGSLLIITSQDLLAEARRIGELHADKTVKYETVLPVATSTQIKELVTKHFQEGDLESVLIFGDESKVKFHSWGGIPSDSYYSYISGNDYISDITLGRLPATNVEEAKFLADKVIRYNILRTQGHGTKKVMLIAHKEDYPGKYTANQEQIRKAANPLGLVFNTQYGGEKATNASVLSEAPESYAIINYRGHGSQSAWYGWDKNGRSFDSPEIDALDNFDDNMAVFFNIACDNGAFQNTSHSMAENLLFSSPENGIHRGAVAVLAATEPSYTDVNHRFDINLFKFIQESQDVTLGNINALANNKLVRDAGGSINDNVKMYVLFSDPLLTPWIQ